jgi:hypothetical protein
MARSYLQASRILDLAADHGTKKCSIMINEAIQAWSHDINVYQPELARTMFLKAQVFEKIGKTQKAKMAYKVAARSRAAVVPGDNRDVRGLRMSDFDMNVPFWTRF